MKSSIWGTTGKEEANRRKEGSVSPTTLPVIIMSALLIFMGSSAECQALRRINNAAAKRTKKRTSNVLRT